MGLKRKQSYRHDRNGSGDIRDGVDLLDPNVRSGYHVVPSCPSRVDDISS